MTGKFGAGSRSGSQRRGKRRSSRPRRRAQIAGFPAWWFGLGAALLLLAAGGLLLSARNAEVTGGEPRAACLLLVDRTASVSNPTTVSQYRDAAHHVVAGCDDLDAEFAVGYFDLSSPKLNYLNGPEESTTFALYQPKGKVRGAQRRGESEQVQAAIDALDELLADEQEGIPVRGSDILTPLYSASSELQAMASSAGVDETYLVVLTDGLQLGETISMQSLSTPEVPIQLLVDATHEVGLVPQLDDVQVSIYGIRGALGPDGSGLEAWFESKVVEYWAAIVDEGGGRSCQMAVDGLVFPGRC